MRVIFKTPSPQNSVGIGGLLYMNPHHVGGGEGEVDRKAICWQCLKTFNQGCSNQGSKKYSSVVWNK